MSYILFSRLEHGIVYYPDEELQKDPRTGAVPYSELIEWARRKSIPLPGEVAETASE